MTSSPRLPDPAQVLQFADAAARRSLRLANRPHATTVDQGALEALARFSAVRQEFEALAASAAVSASTHTGLSAEDIAAAMGVDAESVRGWLASAEAGE